MKEQQFSRFILDSIPVAMVTMDADLKITSFNSRAEELTGYTAQQALGKPCHEILHSSRCENNCPLQTVQEHKEPSTGLEAEFVNRYHEHIPVRIGTAAIENHKGDFIGYLEVIEDMSREKALEREKNNFLFMVAHDMKSPLIAIQGLVDRLQEHHLEMDPQKLGQYFKTITDAAQQIESQVKEFLDFSRQASDQVKLSIEEANLEPLIDNLIYRHRPRALEKSVTLRSEFDKNIGTVKVDKKQLQRVVENLLDNAIKFIHSRGEVVVSTRATGREVIIQVKDNGPGIAGAELPYVFDAFHQSKVSDKGHGLGLAAVKAIVQKHGGRVSVQSSPGKGSVFTVRLPRSEQW